MLLMTITKMSDDMKGTSFIRTLTERRLQIKAQAQAADFFTPCHFSESIVLKKGGPWMRDWPDHELVNTNKGGKLWELSIEI